MRPVFAVIAVLASLQCCKAAEDPALSAMIGRYAAANGVPSALVERVVARESGFNPRARHRSFWGLMQIRVDTARSLGYRGAPRGLLDPATNLTYGVLYLSNAWRVAGGEEGRALRLYSGGYYYEAKRRKRLSLIRTAAVLPPDSSAVAAVAAPVP